MTDNSASPSASTGLNINSAQNYVLGSFNIFNPAINLDIVQLVNNTNIIISSDILMNPANVSNAVKTSYLDTVSYKYTSKQVNSVSEASNKISESLNITASYGIFSGSNSLARTSSRVTTKTSYMAVSMGIADIGAISCNDSLLSFSMLSTDVQAALKAIVDLKSAQSFVTKYGTHIITSIRMGGMFSFFVTAESTSTQTDNDITESLSIGIKTPKASANATTNFKSDIETQYKNNNLSMEFHSLGANVMYFGPPDKNDSNYTTWIDSLKNSWLSVSDTLEFYKLDSTNTWGPILKKYIDLSYLSASLNNPLIYSASTSTHPYVFNTLSLNLSDVMPAVVNTPNLKILSGGARVKDNSNSFLTGSYPQVDNSKTPASVSGWYAQSHDIGSPCTTDEKLYVYFTAIFDPGDYLTVAVNQKPGNNSGPGADSISLVLHDYMPNGFITGGGCQLNSISGHPKFMVSCAPQTPLNIKLFGVNVSDYSDPAQNCSLTGYIITAQLKDSSLLTIDAPINTCQSYTAEHNQNIFPTPNNCAIIGGGFIVNNNGGYGNLMQGNYPITNKKWYGSDKDLNSNADSATQTGFLITCNSSVNV